MNISYLLVMLGTAVVTYLSMFMLWYNGVLEVNTSEEHGDDLKLNINEYDMIRKKSFMIVIIKRK